MFFTQSGAYDVFGERFIRSQMGMGEWPGSLMNEERVSFEEQKVIIPMYRNNYLAGLTTLTNDRHSAPLIRTLDY